MDAKFFENLDKSIEEIKNTDVSGINLNDPDKRLLYLDQLDINTHVIIHSPAIAFFGYKLGRAEAELRACKEDYEKWMKIKKLEAEAQLLGSDAESGYKPSESKKEARVYVNARQKAKETGEEDESEEWVAKIRILEEYRDKIKFWYDGFTAKNFLINTYINRQNAEFSSIDNVKDKTPVERPLSNMKRPNFQAEFKREKV